MDYIKMKNYIPQILLGLLFTVELYLLWRGKKSIIDYTYVVSLLKLLGDFSFGLILATLLLGISSLGIFMLNIINSIIKIVIKRLLKAFLKNRIKYPVIQLSNAEFAFYCWEQNKEQIVNFLKLKYLSNPTLFTAYNETSQYLDDYLKKVELHIQNIKNQSVAISFSTSGGLTQEIVNEANQKKGLELLQQSCFTFLFGTLAYCSYYHYNYVWLCFLMAFVWALLIIPTYIHAKRKFVIYLIGSYLDNFTIGEYAQIEDREA